MKKFMSAIAVIAALLSFTSIVEARALRGVAPSGAVTGRVVQNGFSVTAFPFKNLFKAWGASGSVSGNGLNQAVVRDANGFPTGTLSNNLGGSLFLPADAFLGPMRFKWTGTLGGMVLGLNMTATSGGGFLSGSVFSGTNGDVTFNVNPLTTSATSNSLGYGAKTFTVSAGLSLNPNEKIMVAQTGSLANYAVGTVTSYSGTTLVMDVNNFYGSGTFSSWNVWATPKETNSYFMSGVANSSLSDIILCRDQDFATVTSDPFYHKFLSVLAVENPRILRPMGETLSGGNEQQSNPLWDYRKSLTAMSWSSPDYPPALYAGTSSGSDALTVGSYPAMPGSWTDKETFLFNGGPNTFTVTIASPARFTLPKSVVVGEAVAFFTSGSLPTGLTASRQTNTAQNVATINPGNCGNCVTWYYALDAGSSNISFSDTPGGTAINTSGTQSGTHYMSLTTARVVTAVTNNGSGLPRLTIGSTSGLATNDIVQGIFGGGGYGVSSSYKINVVNSTQIDLTSSQPSGAVINFALLLPFTGNSPIIDPGSSGQGRSFITTSSINVGARGAKQMVATAGITLPPGGINNDISSTGGINVCTYDALLDVVMCGAGGLYTTTMPIEIQVALANRLNKHLWYPVTAYANNATVTSTAQYIAANLNSNLEWYPALSNETWNNAFTQYFYMERRGVAAGYAYSGSGGVQQNYTATGKRHAEIMPLITSAWTGAGRPASKLRRVLSVQAFGPKSLFQSALLNGDDLSAPNNAFPNRPVDLSDVVTYANYWTPRLMNNQYAGTNAEYAPLVTAANDYASGVPAQMTAAMNWMYGDFLGTNADARPTGTTDFSVWSQTHTGGTNADIAPGWETVMASYDAIRAGGGMAPIDVVMYEGGPDAAPPNSGQCAALSISGADCTKITNLHTAFRFDAKGAQMVVDAQSAYISPTFPHNKNGSFLQLEDGGQWALLSGDFLSRPFSFYDGAVQYNQ